MGQAVTRRGLLGAGLAGACSAAAHPMPSTMTLAAAPFDARLVVIILRGGMDGLGVVAPYADPLWADYRPSLADASAMGDLDGFFGLHAGLAELRPLWNRGELGFVHAVSTPYRDKRSHFDGQDLLEAGTGQAAPEAGVRDGWLNRLLGAMPGTVAETAFAVGMDEMRVLRGDAPVLQWSPQADVALTPQAQVLLEQVYARDPLFAAAAAEAMDLAEAIDREKLTPLANGLPREPLAAFAAERLNEGTRVASYSLTGWDTHKRQAGSLNRALARLQRSILSLHEGLGGNWERTAVIAMTEFGRTARENGSRGTDHGTGGLMVLAGGALRGGRIYGDWPGLEEAALYDRRDLMPTADVRAYAASAIQGLFGIGRSTLEGAVFPGLDMGGTPGLAL
ncbi:MAG: DUF1501 domain-containing protein [Rhodobacter sp.]|nr:DUF1501 domain-containing protein [Rhodobacter sp.]